MIHLDIDSEEREDLEEFLQSGLDSFEIEVAYTGQHAFRDVLKQKEGVLQKVLEKLQQGANR